MGSVKTATPCTEYIILSLDEDLEPIEPDSRLTEHEVFQPTDDDLEVWHERKDGYLFVYSNKLEIGYWVNPELVTIK